jgi:DNA repair ATPase RecN
MLKSLKLRDIGPAPRLDVELADRLNIFTGDNGLGKTFILDIAWWALTGDWAGLPAGCDRASAKDFHEIRAVFTRGVA